MYFNEINLFQNSQVQPLTQRFILMVLNALIKAENNLTNICNIMCIEQRGSEQFTMGQAMPNIAEKTLQHYVDNTTRISQDSWGSSKNDCFSCGVPHPWSKQVDGKYVIVCPNANKPGVRKKAKLNISKYQARHKKNTRNNKKCKNVNTVIWEDIPKKQREVILAQQHAHTAVSSSNATSIASSLTRYHYGRYLP
jgi:hypothetical protein